MYNVLDIAKWFLNYDRYICDTEESDGISNMKLQKLLYYAQGVYLALNDVPLFNDEIYAWPHGPVVPAVYHEYKEYGSKAIPFDEDFDIRCITEADTNVLHEVFNVFGQYSAWKLREMTHKERPWNDAPKRGIISRDSIKTFFKQEHITE